MPSDVLQLLHLVPPLQRHATHWKTLQHTTTHLPTHSATLCHTLQHTATHCNTEPQTATHCNVSVEQCMSRDVMQFLDLPLLQHPIAHCYTLQHTLQHTTTRYTALQPISRRAHVARRATALRPCPPDSHRLAIVCGHVWRCCRYQIGSLGNLYTRAIYNSNIQGL